MSCTQPHPRPVTRKHRPTAKGPLQFSPGSPITAVPGERRAYRSAVPVVEEDIADQRSSKLAVGGPFASTLRPFDIVVPAEMPSVEGACDFMVAADAATASRPTATNPVIVRCFVMRTSYSGPNAPWCWVTGTARRFNSNATSMDLRESSDGQRSCPKFSSSVLSYVPRGVRCASPMETATSSTVLRLTQSHRG
jgi:hypothetical protein